MMFPHAALAIVAFLIAGERARAYSPQFVDHSARLRDLLRSTSEKGTDGTANLKEEAAAVPETGPASMPQLLSGGGSIHDLFRSMGLVPEAILPETAETALSRELQSSPMRPQATPVGYMTVLGYASSTCSDSSPRLAFVVSYGMCEQDSNGKMSRVTWLTLSAPGATVQTITNTTQLFSDAACSVAKGQPLVVPFTFESSQTQPVLRQCYPASGMEIPSSIGSLKIDSIASYFHPPSMFGTVQIAYPAGNLQNCQQLSGSFASLVVTTDSSAVIPTVSCQSDTQGGAGSPVTIVSTCPYNENSACLPALLGVPPVSSAVTPAISGHLKARVFFGTSCVGSYHEMVMTYGECSRNFEGRAGVMSDVTNFNVDGSGNIIAITQYYSDVACQTTSGAAFSYSLKSPDSSTKPATVGSCTSNQDPTATMQVSYLIESVGVKMPAWVNGGILKTGFQGANQCATTSSATRLILINSAYCNPDGSGKLFYTITCNANSQTASVYTDSSCQTPLSILGQIASSVTPFSQGCTFYGGALFTGSSDENLYEQQSCIAKPVFTSSSSAKAGTDLNLIGGIAGGVIALLLIGGVAVMYMQQQQKQALAGQDGNGQRYPSQQQSSYGERRPSGVQMAVQAQSFSGRNSLSRNSRGSIGNLPDGGRRLSSPGYPQQQQQQQLPPGSYEQHYPQHQHYPQQQQGYA